MFLDINTHNTIAGGSVSEKTKQEELVRQAAYAQTPR